MRLTRDKIQLVSKKISIWEEELCRIFDSDVKITIGERRKYDHPKKPILEFDELTDDIKKILIIINDYFGVSLDLIMNKIKSRKQNVIIARHFAVLFIREETNLTVEQIGNVFYNIHYTTIIYSTQMIRGRIKVDKNYEKIYIELKDRIENE